jgi:hypothetical protein
VRLVPGNAQRLNGEVALAQAGHELRAQARGQQARQQHRHHGRGDDQRLGLHHARQQRLVAALGPLHQAVFLLVDLVADEQRHGRGNEGDRQDHRAQQRNHHGEGHRVEQLALDTGERKDRQVHDHDDQLAEQQRAPRLLRSREHFMKTLGARERPAVLGLRMREAPHAVLHDHHRPVDDDAEVQRAQAHEVGADLLVHHAGEGEQHRQRNHQRGDQRRADVAQEQEQDRDDQQRAFEQVLASPWRWPCRPAPCGRTPSRPSRPRAACG